MSVSPSPPQDRVEIRREIKSRPWPWHLFAYLAAALLVWYGLQRNQGELTLLAIVVAGAGLGYALLGPKVGQTFRVGSMSITNGGLILNWFNGEREEVSWGQLYDLRIWHSAPRPVPRGYMSRPTELELRGSVGPLVETFEVEEGDSGQVLEIIRRKMEQNRESEEAPVPGRLKTVEESSLEATIHDLGGPRVSPWGYAAMAVAAATLLAVGFADAAASYTTAGASVLAALLLVGLTEWIQTQRRAASPPSRIVLTDEGLEIEGPEQRRFVSWNQFLRARANLFLPREASVVYRRDYRRRALRLRFRSRAEMAPVMEEFSAREA